MNRDIFSLAGKLVVIASDIEPIAEAINNGLAAFGAQTLLILPKRTGFSGNAGGIGAAGHLQADFRNDMSIAAAVDEAIRAETFPQMVENGPVILGVIWRLAFFTLHLLHQRFHHRLQSIVDVDQLVEFLLDGGQLRQHRCRFVFGQQVQRLLRAFDQAGRMRQAAVLVADLGPFARAYSKLLQFADLPLEPLALQKHVPGITLELFSLTGQGAPALVGGSHRFRVILQTGMRIKQHTLRIGFHQ